MYLFYTKKREYPLRDTLKSKLGVRGLFDSGEIVDPVDERERAS